MMGRHFDEGVRSCSSPSTASSHGEGHAADTEMDTAGPSGASGAENTRPTGKKRRESDPPPAQPPPAKKKRTRTLTTPHQSAVLHALLAQSRFPTTAMREEVGRSIGLSARKVQVCLGWLLYTWRRTNVRKLGARVIKVQTRSRVHRSMERSPMCSRWYLPRAAPSSFPLGEGQSPFYMAPPAPFIRFNAGQDSPSRRDAIGPSVTGTRTSPVGHLSGPGVPGPGSSLAPRFPPPSPASQHPHPWQSSNDSQPGAPLSAAAVMPSREFTFSLPFPPLHHMPLPVGGEPALPPPPSPFAAESRPHTPGPFLPHPRILDPARQHRILPLHVPETPHAHSHPHRRPALPFLPHPAERAATSGSSRGGSPPAPVPVRARARRFDPVREAASERSGSQGTDVSTPPRSGTPHA
ncbi:hypothetical protein EDB83DRAFT_2320959 [Lactarius deliciosus]|nr:hypothetical protein EDB83DRAFT_2320959 [Lactarius deliciosus]